MTSIRWIGERAQVDLGQATDDPAASAAAFPRLGRAHACEDAADCCEDTPSWKNQYAATCSSYVNEGHCVSGRVIPGHEWTTGAEFGEPELNCCACV